MVKQDPSICQVPSPWQNSRYLLRVTFVFPKAIQELIKISEGDMRKVRQETVRPGN